MPNNIVWLASYPKSGNTWLRAFLTNYFEDGAEPSNINSLNKFTHGDSDIRQYQKVSDSLYGLHMIDETLALRSAVQLGIAIHGGNTRLVKTHAINGFVNGVKLINVGLTRMAIYIVRDPVDMALSICNHFQYSLTDVAEKIRNPQHRIPPSQKIVIQFVGNWSDHVISWADNSDFPVHVVRYEDMLKDTEGTFSEILTAIGADTDHERIAKAVKFSSFEELKRQELESGFTERPESATSFFRSGIMGEGYKLLPSEVVERICSDHQSIRKRFNYVE